MAWNDETELVVASFGQVYVAPVGTALPTTTTGVLNAAFVGLGYCDEDGVTFSAEPEIEDFPAWQSRQPIRTELVGQAIQAQFNLQQWNEDTVVLAFGGGSITGTTPNYRYNLPSPDAALDTRAAVIEAQDGATHLRWVFSRVAVRESVETQYQRSAPAKLPITLGVLAPTGGGSPGYFLTDSAGFAAGS